MVRGGQNPRDFTKVTRSQPRAPVATDWRPVLKDLSDEVVVWRRMLWFVFGSSLVMAAAGHGSW